MKIKIVLFVVLAGCSARVEGDGVERCADGTERASPARCADPAPCAVLASCTYYLPSEDRYACDELTYAQADAWKAEGKNPEVTCRSNMVGTCLRFDVAPCSHDAQCEEIADQATGCTWHRCPGVVR